MCPEFRVVQYPQKENGHGCGHIYTPLMPSVEPRM